MAPYVTGNQFYGTWIDAGTTAASTTTWVTWNSTGATVTAGGPWSYWTSSWLDTTLTATTWINWNTMPYIAPQRTPEQVAADAEQARIARAQREERQAHERADREQAVQRAETLLHAHLNDRQRRALKTRGVFRVKSMSGRWYEVGRGHHGKLTELGSRGKPVNRLCVYATGGCPDADQMLMQALYLQTDEEQLRKTAYITPVAA